MYVYKMPYNELKQFCSLLDQNNNWEELGRNHMQFDSYTIQNIRKVIYMGRSPTEELLNIWGNQNHTVLELFILLSRMKHYQAMEIIKSLVDEQHHNLIRNGCENLNRLVRNLAINCRERQCHKEPGIPEENFNFKSTETKEKLLNVAKVEGIIESRENNESAPVVNQGNLLNPKSPMPFTGPSGSNISSVAESAGGIRQIPYDDLKKSTNDWDPSTILGKGGFGTVYKGTWICTKVAIKKISNKSNGPESQTEQLKQSITELHCLNSYRHDNILPLYGYSIGGPEPCLVYQYMSGGSLDTRLRSKEQEKMLSWDQRLKIAIGTARGLQFLHTTSEKPLIHGDIKSANILLDPNNMPRIGDFGLAREGPQRHYSHMMVSRIHGTRPYLPDEFLRAKKFSTKVDTYSFGVVLFEIATALGAYSDKRADKFLRDHVIKYEGDILDLKDRKVEGGDDCYKGLIAVGKVCVNTRAKDRPEMVKVLIDLKAVAQELKAKKTDDMILL